MSIHFTAAQDAAIRHVYAVSDYASRRRRMAEAKKKTGLDKGQIYYRATVLGCVTPRKRSFYWTDEEIEILAKFSHETPQNIRLRLMQAGYPPRTAGAIGQARLKKLDGAIQARADAGWYSGNGVAEILGVTSNTVCLWVRKGWLRAERSGIKTRDGDTEKYNISVDYLREFIINYTAHVDLARMDKFLLIDILCPRGAKAAGLEAA
jgi:hypothetical protein